MHNKHLIYPILIILSFTFSCNNNKEDKREALARVFESKLYAEDFNNMIPNSLSPEDSVTFVRNKIDMWVRKQIMLNKAEINLSDKQKDINKIVEDYRASLLIDRYKQEFLKEKLDTTITDSEIEKYFKEYYESFKLNRAVIKALFFKISKKSNENNNFKRLFYSYKEDSKNKIIEFSKSKSIIYKDLSKEWVPFSKISSLLPSKISNPDAILKSNKKLQTQDENYYYYAIIDNYKLTGDVSPLNLVKNQIKTILINKRKTELIKELENNIYQNAIKHGNIEFFDE